MNFQSSPVLPPLRVLVINPLASAAQLLISKILHGGIFGYDQLIDLTILVYSNEIPCAETFKLDLENCAYQCTNSIIISSDLPTISDADVFCIITNFANPNSIDFDKIDTEENFDTFYLILKIANNLVGPWPPNVEEVPMVLNIKRRKIPKKPIKPIFIADGLVAIDILKSLSKDLPADIFFCPTHIPTLGKSVLGEHLKVNCNEINDILIWAASDLLFHVEVEKPLIIHDKVEEGRSCDWNMIGKDLLQYINMDHTQFSPSWLKKEFHEKIEFQSSRNPYGCIYKAIAIARCLHDIWSIRSSENTQKFYSNVGVISDGSLDTIKGCPYVLPVMFNADKWEVNKRFEDSNHLKLEIKRMNKFVKFHHGKLISYCKKFIHDNVINQDFVHKDESESSY